jgi:hypothetical protein
VRRPRRARLDPAAASQLTLVTKDGSGDWAAFLRAGPPEQVARAIGWLHGTASPLLPESPAARSLEAKKPGLAEHIGAPRVEEAAGAVTFDGWYLFQPGSQVSHLVVEGRPDGGVWTWEPLKP